MSFLGAVEQIIGCSAALSPVSVSLTPAKAKPEAPFALPQPDKGIAEVERYLAGRGISHELIHYCAYSRILYQTRHRGYANAVFVGYGADKIPRYAMVRGTRGDFKGDIPGSDKRYSFSLPNASENLHLFESAVDVLSFATLNGIRGQSLFDGDLLSLSGVYKPRKNIKESPLPPALAQYLTDHPDIRRVHLHLDNDLAGRLAANAITEILPERCEVTDEPPPSGKDYNDYLCECLGLSRLKLKERSHAR
jgi:hypothetical protein